MTTQHTTPNTQINSSITGTALLSLLNTAIKLQKKLSFEYTNEWSSVSRKRKFHPYFVKQHQNAWYAIGFEEASDDFRTFRVDKIKDAVLSEESFDKKPFDYESLYKHSVGIFTRANQKPEKIRLKCLNHIVPHLYRDLKDNIFCEVSNDDAYSIMELRVIISEELTEFLLGYSQYIEVIEPNRYREEFVFLLQCILDKYKGEQSVETSETKL